VTDIFLYWLEKLFNIGAATSLNHIQRLRDLLKKKGTQTGSLKLFLICLTFTQFFLCTLALWIHLGWVLLFISYHSFPRFSLWLAISYCLLVLHSFLLILYFYLCLRWYWERTAIYSLYRLFLYFYLAGEGGSSWLYLGSVGLLPWHLPLGYFINFKYLVTLFLFIFVPPNISYSMLGAD